MCLQGKKKTENGIKENGTNPDDPFGDDDDEAKLQAIAQSFEAKYVSEKKSASLEYRYCFLTSFLLSCTKPNDRSKK